MYNIQKIPITNEAYQIYTVIINNITAELTFRWNGIRGLFIMDISVFYGDGTLNREVNGIPMTTGIELVSDFNLGIGEMFCLDISNKNTDSNRDNFGITYQIYSRIEALDVNTEI